MSSKATTQNIEEFVYEVSVITLAWFSDEGTQPDHGYWEQLSFSNSYVSGSRFEWVHLLTHQLGFHVLHHAYVVHRDRLPIDLHVSDANFRYALFYVPLLTLALIGYSFTTWTRFTMYESDKPRALKFILVSDNHFVETDSSGGRYHWVLSNFHEGLYLLGRLRQDGDNDSESMLLVARRDCCGMVHTLQSTMHHRFLGFRSAQKQVRIHSSPLSLHCR